MQATHPPAPRFFPVAPDAASPRLPITRKPSVSLSLLMYEIELFHAVSPKKGSSDGVNIGITCYPTYGGSGIVATELGLELATRGHEIHFITYANPIRLDSGIPRIHYHEVEVSNYPLFQYPPYCLALASRMHRVLRLERGLLIETNPATVG